MGPDDDLNLDFDLDEMCKALLRVFISEEQEEELRVSLGGDEDDMAVYQRLREEAEREQQALSADT